jgi:hypothetical protein
MRRRVEEYGKLMSRDPAAINNSRRLFQTALDGGGKFESSAIRRAA